MSRLQGREIMKQISASAARLKADEFSNTRDGDIEFMMGPIYDLILDCSEKGKYSCNYIIPLATIGQIHSTLVHLGGCGYKVVHHANNKVLEISWKNETS